LLEYEWRGGCCGVVVMEGENKSTRGWNESGELEMESGERSEEKKRGTPYFYVYFLVHPEKKKKLVSK
jgi:hypothetical protein